MQQEDATEAVRAAEAAEIARISVSPEMPKAAAHAKGFYHVISIVPLVGSV